MREANDAMLKVDDATNGVIFGIKVTPKSSRNEMSGIYDGVLKVKIAAPAVGGVANRECIKFLAKSFGVKTSSLTIIRGEKSREKRIMVMGINKKDILKLISKGDK